MTLLKEMESLIARAARRHGPAVVGIDRRAGRGTGIVVADGQVLTLASNLREPTGGVGIAFGGAVGGPGGARGTGGAPGAARATGTVAGIDTALDLALIHVATGDIEPVGWASDGAGLGAAVIALANPGGQGLRATLGFVAAIDRSYRGPRGRLVAGALEHTAALPRGSGGGPLLDLEGRVLGLNAVRVHGGLILTLPGPAVAERAALLGRAETGEPPQLGVAIVSPGVARRLRQAVGLPERDGLLVQEVAPGSPADRALIREGDLIVAAAETPVDGVDDLYAALDRVPAGGTIDLRVVRGVEEHDVAVSLGADR
jgi:serine protease Do